MHEDGSAVIPTNLLLLSACLPACTTLLLPLTTPSCLPACSHAQVVSCFCAALCTRKCSEQQTDPQPVLAHMGTDPARMAVQEAGSTARQLRYNATSYAPMLAEAGGATGFVAADYR